MVELWNYILVAGVSGAAWSLLQFVNKVADREKAERWRDIDVFRVVRSVLLNGIGGGVGVWLLPSLGVEGVSYPLAVAAGVYGEKCFELLRRVAGRLFPPK